LPRVSLLRVAFFEVLKPIQKISFIVAAPAVVPSDQHPGRSQAVGKWDNIKSHMRMHK